MLSTQTRRAKDSSQVRAEERAAKRAAEIDAGASREADGLRQMADKHMEAAAEFIVGRVVKH